jgi:tRNA threonylcarbamoyl adenosine modification protein YeaZ
MKYLFIDTSSSLLSIAILDDDKVIASTTYNSSNDQSKYAVVELEKVFKDSSLDPSMINKIFVINGPGSFTGLRIGVAIAKTYAWALNKKIIPISSLKAHALSLSNKDYYVSIIDARRDYVYAGIYDNKYNDVIEEQYINIEDLNNKINEINANIAITGNREINDKIKTTPIKLDILKIINYYKNNEELNAHELKPNYLKRVEAEEKLVGGIK